MDVNGRPQRGDGGRARRLQRPDDGGARAMLLRALLLLCLCLCVRGQGRRVESMARVERQQQQQQVKPKYEKYHCNGPSTGDYIVGLTREASVDRVVGSLPTYPRNLQKFEVLGNMFAATLSPQDVLQLLDYDAVEYVECDGKVSIGGRRN